MEQSRSEPTDDTPGPTGAADEDAWVPLRAVDGQPMFGGEGRVRVRTRSRHGLLLEVVFPAGVASPIHQHGHDSHLYLISGHLAGTLDEQAVDILPGATLLHPSGVNHSVVALVESHWLEFKAPPGLPWASSDDPA